MIAFKVVVLCLCNFVLVESCSSYFHKPDKTPEVLTDEVNKNDKETKEISFEDNYEEDDSQESGSGATQNGHVTIKMDEEPSTTSLNINDLSTFDYDLSTLETLEEMEASEENFSFIFSSEEEVIELDADESSSDMRSSGCDDEDFCNES